MPAPETRSDVALLMVRAVVGLAFLLHGLDKLGDLSGTEAGFDGMGIPIPEVMAPFVAVTETVGGALLIAGALTPLVGLALGVNMIVAFATAHTGKGFFVQDGGYELVLLLGTASFALMLAGAGRFSVDARLPLLDRFTDARKAREHRVAQPRPRTGVRGASSSAA